MNHSNSFLTSFLIDFVIFLAAAAYVPPSLAGRSAGLQEGYEVYQRVEQGEKHGCQNHHGELLEEYDGASE